MHHEIRKGISMSNIGNIMDEVYEVVSHRKQSPKDGAYTTYLFEKGIDKICKKVGEEAAEVIIAAKNHSKEEMVYEISDLHYHLMVLMVNEGITFDDLYEELRKRRPQ